MDSPVDARFGRAKHFIIVDTERDSFEVVDNTQHLNAPQGAGIQAGQTVASCGVASVITGNVGPKAFSVLKAAGITVFLFSGGTVRDAVNGVIQGTLEQQRQANVKGHW